MLEPFFGPFPDHFGIMLGPFWDHFGTNFGSFWGKMVKKEKNREHPTKTTKQNKKRENPTKTHKKKRTAYQNPRKTRRKKTRKSYQHPRKKQKITTIIIIVIITKSLPKPTKKKKERTTKNIENPTNTHEKIKNKRLEKKETKKRKSYQNPGGKKKEDLWTPRVWSPKLVPGDGCPWTPPTLLCCGFPRQARGHTPEVVWFLFSRAKMVPEWSQHGPNIFFLRGFLKVDVRHVFFRGASES